MTVIIVMIYNSDACDTDESHQRNDVHENGFDNNAGDDDGGDDDRHDDGDDEDDFSCRFSSTRVRALVAATSTV